MIFFPQIGAGSVAQFPLRRTRRWRRIVNTLENGSQIALPDTGSDQIGWGLAYRDLTDGEVTAISQLYAAAQGGAGAFTFIDPMANLLGWSEDFSKPDWQSGLLQCSRGSADPLGTARAWSIVNNAAGAQVLAQTLGIPGEYAACFSVYARSEAASTIVLTRDGRETTVAIGPAWRRVSISTRGTGSGANSTFSVSVGAGRTIQLWGAQVEAQPSAGQYKTTQAALGIYAETNFGSDELKITSTGPGLSACEITLVSRA